MAGISPAYFTNLTDKVNGIAANISAGENAACTAIQQFEQQTIAEIQAVIDSARAQITALLPMTTIPSSLGGCISWITSAAQPYILAVAAAEAQVAALVAGVASVEAAIQNAAGSLTSCSVTPTPVV